MKIEEKIEKYLIEGKDWEAYYGSKEKQLEFDKREVDSAKRVVAKFKKHLNSFKKGTPEYKKAEQQYKASKVFLKIQIDMMGK